jgi:hypothetical protein
MADFLESYVEAGSRYGTRKSWVVVDEEGEPNHFKSARSANAEFPGAFNEHPDFDEEWDFDGEYSD